MPYMTSTRAEAAFSSWKQIHHVAAVASPALSGTHVMYPAGSIVLAGAASAFGAFYLDPADYAVSGRTTKLRLRAYIIGNAVAPAADIGVHLYPVATWNGASGNRPGVATVGASVCSASWTAPAANTREAKLSSIVTHPAAGFYAIAFVLSTATAANSNVEIAARLQLQQIP